jgi:hypothetical protein
LNSKLGSTFEILVGWEGDLEKPLVDYATENGYQSLDLAKGLTLWIAPSPVK